MPISVEGNLWASLPSFFSLAGWEVQKPPAQPEKPLSCAQSHMWCFQAVPHGQLQPPWQFALQACSMLPGCVAGWRGQEGSSIPPATLFQARQNPRSPLKSRLWATQRSSVPPGCLLSSCLKISCPHRANKTSCVEEQGVGGSLPERSFCCEGRTESTGESGQMLEQVFPSTLCAPCSSQASFPELKDKPTV